MATNSSSSIQNINNWRLWTQKNKHNDYSIIDKIYLWTQKNKHITQVDDDYSIIDKIYLYVKDPDEPKYQYLIKKRKNN